MTIASTAPARRDATGAPHTAGRAVRAAVREQVGALEGLEDAVRADAPDAVHRMRVAARRLRAVLHTYRRVLDPDVTGPLRAELAWAAGELGRARDAEVVGPALLADCAALPADEIVGPVAAALRAATAARHEAARECVRDCLDSDRFAALRARLDALVAEPPWSDHATRQARPELTRALRRSLRRLRGSLDEAAAAEEESPGGALHDQALHEVRKTAKRLRYATEVAVPQVGRPARALLDTLGPLQQILGERQDTVVARATLRELAAEAGARGESEFTYGALHARQAARAATLDLSLSAACRTVARAAATWPG